MATSAFGDFLVQLQSVDFFTLLLPFLVTYVLFLFALRNLPNDMFGDDSNAPAIIALAAAFFLAQFIASNPIYQQFFIDFFGRLTVGLIGLLGLMVILGMAGFQKVMENRERELGILLIIVVGLVFTYAGGVGAIVPVDFPALGSFLNYLFESGAYWIFVVGALIYMTGSGGGIMGE